MDGALRLLRPSACPGRYETFEAVLQLHPDLATHRKDLMVAVDADAHDLSNLLWLRPFAVDPHLPLNLLDLGNEVTDVVRNPAAQ